MKTTQEQSIRSVAAPHPSSRITADVRLARDGRGRFLATEAALLSAMLVLGLLTRAHPGPFPGDLGLSLAWERLVRPNATLTTVVEFFGNATWPLQAVLIGVGIAAVFAYFRRWLDIIVSAGTAGLASLTNYSIMQLVHRPRPVGPGLHVDGHVGFPSFPSGHVEHALAFYGIVLFLTFQVRRPQPLLWLVRVLLILVIVMEGPSRLVTGEHWPSDILAALIWGAFWLVLAIHVYHWGARRWPALVPNNERKDPGNDDTPGRRAIEPPHEGPGPGILSSLSLHAKPTGQITALIAVTIAVVAVVVGNLLAPLGTWAITVIHTLSYLGVFALLLLENLFPPVPSEVILPLTGFLVGQGKLIFVFAFLAATAGSVTGALVFYGLGRWLEEERLDTLVDRYGRYLLLRREDLNKARVWFHRHGEAAVLLGRMVPGVRSLISIPAGVIEMPLWRFLLYTTIGSGGWNAMLIGAGWMLGNNWSVVQHYVQSFEYMVTAFAVLAAGWFIWKRLGGRHGAHSRSTAGSSV